MFLAIMGLIGAGKTTLATSLSQVMEIPVYYEPVDDNPVLPLFYKDMTKYAFPLQIWLLNRRYRQQQTISWSNKGAIVDRSFYEDQIFVDVLTEGGFMTEIEKNIYIETFDSISNTMSHPNCLIYLRITPEEAMRRINIRNRECEKDLPVEYLRSLHIKYEKFIDEISKQIPVIIIDWNDIKLDDIYETKVMKLSFKIKKTLENMKNITMIN